MRNKTMKIRTLALVLTLVALAFPAAAQVDFTKIEVIGASVDSGFIDNCWVRHGQTDSWPAIFARAAGVTNFEQPIINEPGLGNCMILASLAPSFTYGAGNGTPANFLLNRPYNNLAIPGYLAASVSTCTANTGTLPCNNGLIDVVLRLQGATVLQQAASVQPTFVIVGVLGNEILGPGTSGTVIDNVTLMPTSMYAAAYKAIVDGMKTAQGGTGKGVVATIPDVTSLPYFTTVSPILGVNPATGAPIYVLGDKDCGSAPACPVPAGTMVPLSLGGLMKVGMGVPCAVAPTLPYCNHPLHDNGGVYTEPGLPSSAFPGLLYPSELTLLRARTGEFNAQIRTLAEADGYRVFDTAALISDLAAHGTSYAGLSITSSYLTGGFFSYDGVHPTALGYAIVADAMVQFVNAQYGMNVSRVNMYPYLFEGNSSGGYPGGSIASQSQIIDWAAAYFTPEVLEQFARVFPAYRLGVQHGGDESPHQDPRSDY